jgi:aspartate ammonia-lyase
MAPEVQKEAQSEPRGAGASATRLECDLLGEVRVPAGVLYGAQTQRAVENFPLRGQRTLGGFPTLTRGLLLIKRAAAQVNGEMGLLEPAVSAAIIAAADTLLAQPDPLHFPIHHLHGGGGTSANMNANEVLANLAEERLGGRRGHYARVHPNDHVNANQSTNDVYPTACHIAVILQWPALSTALAELEASLLRQAASLHAQPHLARTCLQDAVAITFGDFFGGHAALVRRCAGRIARAVEELYAVPLGGTIVGRASDVPQPYFEAIIPALCAAAGEPRYHRSENLFDAAQNLDDLVQVSAQLALLACGPIKMAQDLRLLSSGPEAGLGELRLPAVQPGSSIMPGKVNPVIPEHAIQLSFKVLGNHRSCVAALEHGELDLNVWESTAVCGVLESMELLESAAQVLHARCIDGLEVDAERNARHTQTIIPELTALMQRYGYSRVSDICKQAEGDVTRLRQLLREAFPADGP